MSVRYDRAELLGILAARYGQTEGQGERAFIELRIKVTPELLESMLGGVWETADGKRARLDHVWIDADGYAEPAMVAEVPA